MICSVNRKVWLRVRTRGGMDVLERHKKKHILPNCLAGGRHLKTHFCWNVVPSVQPTSACGTWGIPQSMGLHIKPGSFHSPLMQVIRSMPSKFA